MNEVKNSIGDALKIQRRASEEFTLSSGALNENIEATTSIIGKLARPIEDGLRAVSDSGQHMRSVGRSLDKSLESMQNLVECLELVPEALKPLSLSQENHKEIISALDPLHSMRADQQEIIQEVKGIRSDIIANQSNNQQIKPTENS
jgi:type II secretory pathway component PulF